MHADRTGSELPNKCINSLTGDKTADVGTAMLGVVGRRNAISTLLWVFVRSFLRALTVVAVALLARREGSTQGR